MLKTLFLVGFASVLTALPALAENWVLVARSDGGTEYYIDTESVQGSNGTYLFWRMSVNPRADENGVVAEKTYVSMSCPLQGWRPRLYVRFNAQGELISREDLGESEPLQFFTNGSVGEAVWSVVCE